MTRLSTSTRRRRTQRQSLRPELLGLESRQLLSTFTVSNTLDDGSVGSLRWAIGEANANVGADTVAFDSSFFAPRKRSRWPAASSR